MKSFKSAAAMLTAIAICIASLSTGADAEDEFRELYLLWQSEMESDRAEMAQASTAEVEQVESATRLKFTRMFLELAKRSSQDDTWLDCLMWLAQHGQIGPDLDAAFAVLSQNASMVNNHVQLQLAMSLFIPVQATHVDPALRAVVNSEALPDVRGAALFALASRRKTQGEIQGDATICAEAAEFLHRVSEEFPDVRTYSGRNGELAESLLAELQADTAIGQIAPRIQGVSLVDENISIDAAASYQVILLSFSGHWCRPCRSMHPELRDIQESYSSTIFTIVEINSDPHDQLDQVKTNMERDGLSWTMVCDGRTGPITESWNVAAFPTYILIDADGRIRHRIVGANKQALRDLADTLIRETQ